MSGKSGRFAWILAVLLAGGAHGQVDRALPNIVLIVADDLGAECLGCYGGTSYRTHHLDALAARGVLFENAYATPLCTPSRVQLMTGQYPFRTGWDRGIWARSRSQQVLDPGEARVPGLFKKAGYTTAVAGKWQLARVDDQPDHPTRCGFDEHCVWAWAFGEGKQRRYWNPSMWQNGKRLENTKGRFGPFLCRDFLVAFMKRNRNRPFFIYYPMILAHRPTVYPKGVHPARVIAGLIRQADENVGKIIKAVDELGMAERTVILFTADNGINPRLLSRAGGREVQGGKFQLTESGVRVPLVVRGPDLGPAGRRLHDLVDFTDILPTLLDLAGIEPPKEPELDGTSFGPQLRGEPGTPRSWVFCQLGDDWCLRDRRWRLRKDGELFDHKDRYAPVAVRADPDDSARAARARLTSVARSLLKGSRLATAAAPPPADPDRVR